MIVKTGREYIVKNGFNPNKIAGYYYGNTDEGGQVVKENDTFSTVFGSQNPIITYMPSNTPGFSIVPTTSEETLSYVITATIDNSQANSRVDTFGLYTESNNIKTMFSRVTFPEYTVKNSCTLNFTYYLYF